MVRIRYDDREEFPWVVWVGLLLWGKYRTLQGALNAQKRLEQVVQFVRRETKP